MNWDYDIKNLIKRVKDLLEKYATLELEGVTIKGIDTEEKDNTEFPHIRIHLSNKDAETCVFFKSYVYDREQYINVVSGKDVISFGEGEFRGGIPTASAETRMKNFLKKIFPKKY